MEDYFHVQRSLLIRKTDESKFHTIADFENKTIGVTPGSSADIDTEARKPVSTKTKPYHDQALAVKDLLEGSIDAFCGRRRQQPCNSRRQGFGKLSIRHEDGHPKKSGKLFELLRRRQADTRAPNAGSQRLKDEYLNIDV